MCNKGSNDVTSIVYNNCYGGFGLSDEAILLYCKLANIDVFPETYSSYTIFWLSPSTGNPEIDRKRQFMDVENISRSDPILVSVVETLEKKANGSCSDLRIITLPKGTLYKIDEYDGNETVVISDNVIWNIA